MDPVIELDQNRLTVEPGGQTRIVVRVHNNNTIVEGYRVVVLGEPAAWARVTPDELSVYPQQDAESQVVFSPPAGGVARAGQIPFGVQVVSRIDPMSAAVAEGDITVGTVTALNARIAPVSSTGRWSGRHRVEIANWGNAPVRLFLDATDPDEKLTFLVQPPTVDLAIGSKAQVRVKVRTRSPFFRGAPVRRSFRLVGRPAGPDGRPVERPPNPGGWVDPSQVAVDGAFQQRAILGRGATAIAVAAALALGVGAFVALRGGGDDDSAGPVTVAPERVNDLQVAGTTQSEVNLKWTPLRNVDSYEILQVDPQTSNTPNPNAIAALPPVDGELAGTKVADLDAGTEYCFQIRTKRGDAESQLSAPVCGMTAVVPGTPTPAAPSELSGAIRNDKVELTWTNNAPDAQIVVYRNSKVLDTIEPTEVFADPDGQVGDCYVLRSTKDGAPSDISNQWCVEAPATSAGAGGGGSIKDLGVIALLGTSPIESDPTGTNAQGVLQRRIDDGFTGAEIIKGSDYPDMPTAFRNRWLIVVKGFATKEDAQVFCGGKSNCQAAPF
jgi:hypothetical protein